MTGSSTSTSSTGFYYSYGEYTDSSGTYANVYENYTYSSSGQTDYSEFFSYSSQDGVTVDYVSEGYSDYIYDSEGRLTQNTSLNNYQYDYGSNNQGSGTYSSGNAYVYANTTGYELDSSTSTYSGTYTYNNGSSYSYSSTTVSEYAYTSTPTSVYDYNQRRDVISYDNDGDGVTDTITYSLYSDTASGSTSVFVSTDANGVVTSSGESDYTYISSSNGYTNTGESSYASDYDGDGIIDYTNESSYDYAYDSSYNLISSSSEYIYKSDYDEDGKADYVSITKESRNQTSGKRLEIIWEENGSSPATLSIGIDKDTNGDYTYDSTRGFTFGFGAPPTSWTTMGSQVATLNDTLIV